MALRMSAAKAPHLRSQRKNNEEKYQSCCSAAWLSLPVPAARRNKARSRSGCTAKSVDVTTAKSVVKEVPAAFDETGTFVAEESSDIAPPVAGRILRTPVDVGAFVKQGQVICELDHRDADLKLQQVARAIGRSPGDGAAGAIAHRSRFRQVRRRQSAGSGRCPG